MFIYEYNLKLINCLIYTDIQSWWEVPSIAHFCFLFRQAFDLLEFDIEVIIITILLYSYYKK